jgi:co-chaperonin GroES (HSP10)
MSDNGKMNYFGGDTAISMANAKPLEESLKDAAIEAYNKNVDSYKKALDEKTARELEEAQRVTEKMESMEIVPVNSYVLVRPYEKNPFEKIEVTNSGIVIPTYDGSFKNPDSGEQDTEYNLSVQADVIEVGPDCKYVKEGDVVYYRRACGVPIPFFRQGFEVVAEQQIHVVINEGIKARFAKLKKNGK